MKKLNILTVLALVAALVGGAAGGVQASVNAAPAAVGALGSVNVAPANPRLTAVDPLAYVAGTDVIPARPFLYSVDENGITITRFNDNKVVGTWPWPASIWIELPDGTITEIPAPAGGWDPVAMTVSAPTDAEIANRVKEIPDLTPPWTFVYVVMARSGYEWQSNPDPVLLESANVRDHLVLSTNPDTESAILVQINVSDPSFSTSRDPTAPTDPHIAGAILSHGAGQPVYDRKTGNVYVGNMPSGSLPAGLTSFVSVIHRISPEVTESEPEVPGISKPVIRCGPQHPETGIPVGRPQAYACYDPSGTHPINDNEHVGAFGEIKQWDTTNPDLLQEQYVWEFRNLPDWLTPHLDLVTGQYDGILYGTPPATGEWYAEARVHNLGDEYGVFSDWHPIRLLVTPSAEYLPVKVQFAAGVPVAYQLEGTGACTLSGAPTWVDVQTVPNGCVVMGRAPISGERYEFAMPGFRETSYPDIPIVFSGDVVGAYNFDPLPEGVGLSGLAWHQVEKYADPSTETPVLTLEYIGVDPSTGQLYQILQPAGQPQPPNERPAETAIKTDTVSTIGAPLNVADVVRYGEVAVEADRDIFVAAIRSGSDGALVKVAAQGGGISTINLPGVQPNSLSLDSDLRTAIIGVEPGQVDNGTLWAAGTGNAAVVDTDAGTVAQTFAVSDASSVSVDFGTRYGYVAAPVLQSVAIFGPGPRLPMAPRIWSSEEVTYNRGYGGTFLLMATGDPVPTLTLTGELPDGLSFVDNGDGTATLSGTPTTGGGAGGGCDFEGEGDPEGGDPCGDYVFAVTATNAEGSYAQAFGISVNIPPTINSGNTATFTAGSASAFQVHGTGYPTPIFFQWELPAPGLQLVDNEDGTASLAGTPEIAGTYVFTIYATTGAPPDAEQAFTLVVNPAGTSMAPVINSLDTATWPVVGAPFGPDPVTVAVIGSPTPILSVTACSSEPAGLCTSDNLPLGVSFVDNGDGTATLGSGLMTLFDGTEGTYTLTINASNDSGTATQTFTLIVEPNTSILSATPATMSFTYTFGGTMPAAQTLSVGTLGDTMPYAAVTTARWLKAAPVSGLVPGDLSVSVDPTELAALAPGTYTGSVIVTSAGTEGPFATSLVTLVVTDVPMMALSSNMLSFAYTVASGKTPAAQTVSLSSGGVPVSYAASTSAAWLRATPANGTTPGDLSVSVDPKKVGLGTHIGSVTIDGTGAGNGPQTISVILFKKATSLTDFSPLVKVSFNVGSGPEGLAIDLKTHQLFINTGNEAAESAETGSESATVEEPVDPAAGDAVFRFDPATMTVAGRVLVHSQGEYVAVNSKTHLVYHASQGTSEIVVIDESANKAVAYIPLWGTDGVYMRGMKGPYQPYQIAVDEKQNLIYVGAKAPPVPDPIPVPGKPFACRAIHEMPDDEYDCWNPGSVFVIDGKTNKIVGSFLAGDDPEGVVFVAATGKVYASNEDDGSVTVAKGAIRNKNGSITPAKVIGTIIKGKRVAGWWQPTCDANNYCGERGQAALWPQKSTCNGIDDEAEEADKMAVGPFGNVYIIDDRYRVARINGLLDKVDKVLAIPGYDCEVEVPDGSNVVLRNTANNIAMGAFRVKVPGTHLYVPVLRVFVTSEQNTVSLIDPISMELSQIITIEGAGELDAITADPARNSVFITDEELSALWILQGK